MAPTPRLYVDLQAAQSTAHAERGIARYSIELTRALVEAGATVDTVGLNPHLPRPRALPPELGDDLVRWRTSASLLDTARRGPFAYVVASPVELELPPRRTIPQSAIRRADLFVTVMYDVIPLVYPDRYLASPALRESYCARLALVRNADLVLTISEHTRRDVVERVGVAADRVVSIGGGVSPWFSPGPGDPDRRAPYVLCVSGWEWRKNTERLIRAFGALPEDLRRERQLVIACAVPPEGVEAWQREARDAGLAPGQLVVTGYVDDERLRALYRGAELFVFPSLYEGFGLPVAEAARCGVPVLTSATSSLPEILDLPESTFDPEDEGAIAGAMERALRDPGFRARLLDAGARASGALTWRSVAARASEAIERAAASAPPARRRPPRVRLALAGPLPPVPSGIAVYNERVVKALAAHGDFDLCLYAEGARGERPRVDVDVPVYPVEALDSSLDPHDHDVFVHTIGNQTWHVRGFDLARRHPGILWLHDASLVGLHLEWALWQIRTGRTRAGVLDVFRRELADLYGGRVPPERVLVEPLSHRSFVAAGVHLVAGLVRSASHVVLNSTVARDMVEADLGPDGRCPPVTVLHHAVPPPPDGFTPTPDAQPLVVALGVVHAVKRPSVLVEAVAALGPDVQLAFVGSADAEARAEVEAAARAAGIADRVRVTGHVDAATYWRWLARAHLAVQLREPTFGESSGAVHDAVAAGVPVITSVAACRDLPGGVVDTVAADAGAAELAGAMRALLADAGRRDAMRDAQRRFADDWTFERVASELAEVVRRTVLSR